MYQGAGETHTLIAARGENALMHLRWGGMPDDLWRRVPTWVCCATVGREKGSVRAVCWPVVASTTKIISGKYLILIAPSSFSFIVLCY